MVSSFEGVSQANPAFVVGLLVSVFTFSEFVSGTIWARVSDRIGRKPTLLIGAFAATLLAVCFGFSNSVSVAVAIRALGGLTNPNVGVVQTCVGELVRNKEHQGTAASLRLIWLLRVDAELIQNTLCSKSFLSGTIPEGSWVTNSSATCCIETVDNVRAEA